MSRQSVVKAKENREKTEFGFWLYLMSDVILFASLFAAYMILRNGIADGPAGSDIFNPKLALVQTIILLTSSFTCGVAALAFRFQKLRLGLGLLTATIILGTAFLTLELIEFNMIVGEGYTWQSSAFLSAFFTLVATHGLHVAVGLLWATVVGAYIATHGLTDNARRKFGLFTMFWHFLDLVWIFIFTVVYLGGVL